MAVPPLHLCCQRMVPAALTRCHRWSAAHPGAFLRVRGAGGLCLRHRIGICDRPYLGRLRGDRFTCRTQFGMLVILYSTTSNGTEHDHSGQTMPTALPGRLGGEGRCVEVPNSFCATQHISGPPLMPIRGHVPKHMPLTPATWAAFKQGQVLCVFSKTVHFCAGPCPDATADRLGGERVGSPHHAPPAGRSCRLTGEIVCVPVTSKMKVQMLRVDVRNTASTVYRRTAAQL